MEALRVLRQPMSYGNRPGTFAIVQAAAIDDKRMGASALRMLLALGIYRDADGWCWPKQQHLADRLGISQQAVSRALRELADMGYIEIHAQYDERTGARISSRYRVIMDFDLPPQFRRTQQRDIVTPQLQIVAPTTSEVVAPTSPGLYAPQREVVANKEELTHRELTQEEQPKKERSNERSPGAPQAQKMVIDLIVAGGAPSPTFSGRDGKAIKESGESETIAAAYLAVWRGEWGDDWLRDNLSIHVVVARLDGFKLWQREQAPPPPTVNGTASKLVPPTDEDRAIWDRARTDLAGLMNRPNYDAYIEPLTIAGRLESGALCVIVPSAVGSSVARFKGAIAKTLIDAGDAAGAAVAFKARRSQENHHAE